MSGEKSKQQPTETTEKATVYELKISTSIVADRVYVGSDYPIVTASVLKDGEILVSQSFNWDANDYYRSDVNEWAKRIVVTDRVRINGDLDEVVQLEY